MARLDLAGELPMLAAARPPEILGRMSFEPTAMVGFVAGF